MTVRFLESTESITPKEEKGFRMIESLHLENFRCFKTLELHGLQRINVVVGGNATGKTVLLEAMAFGLRATPPNIFFLNQLRGFQPLLLANPTPEVFRSYFTDLFHNFDEQSTISISTVDSKNRHAKVRIYFDPKHAVTTQQAPPQEPLGFQPTAAPPTTNPPVTTIIPLAFDRTAFTGETSSLYATVQLGNPFFQPGPELGVPSMFFSSGYLSAPAENANWLSRLSVEKKGEMVLSTVRKHFPFVHGLSSEQFLPGIQAVYADIPNLSKKLPASFVSWGFNRLLTFILAISNCRDGVVMIDEVENGIFHDQLPQVWRTLLSLAEEHDAQLFVSTHSKECLRAALPTVRDNEDKFTLLRTDRVNGSCGVTPISGKLFESSLEQGFEVR